MRCVCVFLMNIVRLTVISEQSLVNNMIIQYEWNSNGSDIDIHRDTVGRSNVFIDNVHVRMINPPSSGACAQSYQGSSTHTCFKRNTLLLLYFTKRSTITHTASKLAIHFFIIDPFYCSCFITTESDEKYLIRREIGTSIRALRVLICII